MLHIVVRQFVPQYGCRPSCDVLHRRGTTLGSPFLGRTGCYYPLLAAENQSGDSAARAARRIAAYITVK
ncbi:hypothetical protein CA54_21050 [Symmachiella macrocystis]|uniref:Uncharacterized protein n=1 Tax=Symmachiella macrocystis TaxID=2527985 RepID=A0A5C6BNH7_9PLAN|nr:hypothetical protein CA54_21050 [Symmachiella macrocystis]